MLTHSGRPSWRPVRFVLLAVLLASPAAAQSPPRTLTLADALARAASQHPSLRAAGLASDAARHRALDADRRPAPRLEAALDNWGGSLGTAQAEATLQLTQTLERGGDRAARAAVAAADVALADADRALALRAVQADATAAFVSAWLAHERRRQLAESASIAADALAAAGARVREGAASPVERLRAESALALTQAEHARSAAEVAAADRALALHWAAPEADFDSLALPQPSTPLPADSAAWFASLAAHPEVAAAAARVRAAQAGALAARAAGTADVDASVGARHLRESEGTGFVAGVSLPLPFGNRQQGARAAAGADASRAQLEQSAAQARLASELRSAIERWRAASAALRPLAERVLPAADEALALVRAGYRAGRWGYADLADASRAALDARRAWLDATGEAWRAKADVMRLTGGDAAKGEVR